MNVSAARPAGGNRIVTMNYDNKMLSSPKQVGSRV